MNALAAMQPRTLGTTRPLGAPQWNLAAGSTSQGSSLIQDGFEFSSLSAPPQNRQSRKKETQEAPVEFKNYASYYDASSDSKARDTFYGDTSRFEKMSGSQLFDELSDLVHGKHRPLDYKPDRYLYPIVDRHSDGELYCVYSGEGPMNEGDASGQNPLQKGGYNCEHVVPQSWFNKKPAPRGDLHHLFASVISCNSLRGNSQLEEGIIAGESLPACGILDKSKNLFTPHAGRGETARATLYFMMAYPGMIGDSAGEYGVKDLPMLLQWHKEDPVSDYERHRNANIEKLQGNRNPLIDFPELADKIEFARGMGRVA